MIRFHFLLRPIDQVMPWEDGLHWFALTDGWYWISVGDVQLLRYTPATARTYRMEDIHPYVDYFVVRLWEDLLVLTPQVLRPVPADLLPFIAADPSHWHHRVDDLDPDHPANAAVSWHEEHVLDCGYLRQPPYIRMWRTVADADTVTVAWSHRTDADIRFTAPVTGRADVPTATFLTAVRRLDAELMGEMNARVSRLERTGPPAGVTLDLARLRAEHTERATWLGKQLRGAPREFDLAEVRDGVRFLGFL